MKLTAEHEHVLEMIGRSGGTRRRLAGLVGNRELLELERGGYVWRELVETGPCWTGTASDIEIWYLTDLGASAIHICPTRIYHG